jgi:glucose-6-phosphate isomerase
MSNISLDYSRTLGFIKKEEIEYIENQVFNAHEMLHSKRGPGNDYLGWVELPEEYDREEFARIERAAERIKEKCDVFIVIGIGGSYLGARAAIEMLNHSFYNMLPKDKRKTPEIYFAGNNISPVYLNHLMDLIEGKDVCINVISKSGTTTEPAIAFRIFKEYMEKKYGKKEVERILY